MTRFLLLVILGVCAVGCFEENKVDCRNDGDCRAARICRGGVCVPIDVPPAMTGPGQDAGAVMDVDDPALPEAGQAGDIDNPGDDAGD